MIEMQRSSSLPGHSHTSPPSLSNESVSIQRNATPFTRPSKYQRPQVTPGVEDRDLNAAFKGDPGSGEQEWRSAEIKSKDSTNTMEAAILAASRVHQPMLEDEPLYNSPLLKGTAADAVSTNLEELAHLVRLSKFQERKCSQFRIRLQRSLISTALSARLARCGELSHRTLVDDFRSEDKKSFATLYNAIDDVRNSFDAGRRLALLEPDLDTQRPKLDQAAEPVSFSNFMQEIPSQSRDILLNFLTQIRTNPDYLATRICSLTTTEMSAMTIFHQGLEPIDSVLPFHSRTKGQSSGSNRTSAHIPSPVERLISFQRHDPLSAIIHTCFANSAGPDSDEDLRRTDIMACVCARLITENRSGLDPFICSVLNIWAAMRDWSGKNSMEWYLMKILEDGAFLLEKAEDQAGTRIHVEPRNAKDSMAADEFYDAAIKGLFEVIDDPEAAGIPEGVIELGNAILRKLDGKRHAATKRFLVTKWLFSVFLLNVIVQPESYGMMLEYHITDYGRQKILKEVALRARCLVVDLTWKQATNTPPEISVRIENILGRFQTVHQSRPTTKLLPARSITSLRETFETHPYIVISPSDIVTLVNALFPERRPVSAVFENKDVHYGSLRSAASSVSGVSGISIPVSIPSQSRGFDTASIISNSNSSVISDATSREPIFEDGSVTTNRFSSTSISSMSQATRYEDEGYVLRMALREMAHTLGADATAGSCHPCAEQWAVMFIDADGEHLSTQIIYEDQDGIEYDEGFSNSDSETDSAGSKPDFDKEYLQLRDTVLKLVQDYEVPQPFGDRGSKKTFSNKTSGLNSLKRKQSRSKDKSHGLGMHSKNFYGSPEKIVPIATRESGEGQLGSNESQQGDEVEPEPPMLLKMLEAAEMLCRAQSDFVNSHLYWKTSQQLHHLSSPTLKENGFSSLLGVFSRGPRDAIRRYASAIEEYDAWLVWLKQCQERHDNSLDLMMKSLRALRDKMWYGTDVRNSAAYEGARNVAVALKSMGSSKSRHMIANVGRPRNVSRSSTTNFLLKTEAQVLDILAASEEHGGPNKLSDEQSDRTLKWLSQNGIENFCKGEERIHRFCLEIETCVNKLVGDSLMEGPVLWSSDLFQRDKRFLDTGKHKGDLVVTQLGTLSVSGENWQDHETGRRSLRGLDTTRTGRDLRTVSARNGSQQSFESNRWSIRSGIGSDYMDSQDYFGTGSPVLTIDSATTFWSPFQTRMHSPSTSMTSFRPGTSSTINETVINSNSEDVAIAAKQTFLKGLKQTLTALLISDLGSLVFARGSETDSWFTGNLGQECMDRKERQDRKSQKKIKKRVIEKKKSFRDLRSAQNTEMQDSDCLGEVEDVFKGVSATSGAVQGNEERSVIDNSSLSDALNGSSYVRTAFRDKAAAEFPYKSAFQRLLKMFSVHPNPYEKLNALYELEQLVIASLTSKPRRKVVRQETATTSINSPMRTDFASREAHLASSRAKTLDEIIDNCKERRSHTSYESRPSFSHNHSAESRSGKAFSTASTDMIVEVLQELFRESGMRPRTLFRDLQFIAAFIPASILDKTDRGKAFWDVGLAALGVKQEVCRTFIEIADEIVLHYTSTRQMSSSFTIAPQSQTQTSLSCNQPEADIMRYGMQDAARMWTITAKEGDAVAERELAIFYLTHPELVERTTFPLTRPSETFKAQVMEMHAGGGEGDRERSDPATMCVAYHWMELSALGGDELAKKYLRQREELNALP